MCRTIITPPDLSGAPLAELKSWLAISSSGDDAALMQLLHGALDMCEAFTGQMPLEAACEELWPALGRWQALSACPVQAIANVEGVASDGSRVALAGDDYEIDIDASGTGHFRIRRQIEQTRVAVRFTAGLALSWEALPDALRHGLIRLAAASYRRRDETESGPTPPAAVAALWRPWRRLRVA